MPNFGRHGGHRGRNRRMGQFLDLTLLLLLEQSPAHGYTLLRRLAEFDQDFLAPTVVYRELREMESRGWVSSTWDEEEALGPPRRVYALTEAGREVLRFGLTQIRGTQQVLEYILALHAEIVPQEQAAGAPQFPEEVSEMAIVVPANGADLDAPTSPVFGRAQFFVFVDPETLAFEALPNPAVGASGGAGVQAAQVVLQHGVKAVIAPSLGPNAFRVIVAAEIPAYQQQGATVREVVEAYNAGHLARLDAPGAEHVGLGGGRHRGGHGEW